MRARFLGDPVERSKGRFTNPPGDWFDVPEGMEDKYANNSHFEVDAFAQAGDEPVKRRPGRPRKLPPPYVPPPESESKRAASLVTEDILGEVTAEVAVLLKA